MMKGIGKELKGTLCPIHRLHLHMEYALNVMKSYMVICYRKEGKNRINELTCTRKMRSLFLKAFGLPVLL
jgi:hypothetical protein